MRRLPNVVGAVVVYNVATMMRTNWYRLLLLLCVSLPLLACRPAPADVVRGGAILLWHGWDEEETAVLHNILDQFADVHPEITVIAEAVAANELEARYKEAASSGLGPDLVIGSSDWVAELAQADLLVDLRPAFPDGETHNYAPTAMQALRADDGLYGLPLALESAALYYNTTLVDDLPKTLEELLLLAEAGQAVGIEIDFEDAFWGIQAFGGQMFVTPVENQPPAASAFADWLQWLKMAQENPGVFLNRDKLVLRKLFTAEQIAYYVGSPSELTLLREMFGDDAPIGVVSLPAGPDGAAGPRLQVEAVLFNAASTAAQHEMAFVLGRFLTNAEQGTTLMRETGRVSANQRVRVDRRAYPLVAGFASQAKTAVVPPTHLPWAEIDDFGDDVYTTVLSGERDAATAVCQFMAMVYERPLSECDQ